MGVGMANTIEMQNKEKINHLFSVINTLNETSPKHCAWLIKQIEDMNFKEEYEDKNA